MNKVKCPWCMKDGSANNIPQRENKEYYCLSCGKFYHVKNKNKPLFKIQLRDNYSGELFTFDTQAEAENFSETYDNPRRLMAVIE